VQAFYVRVVAKILNAKMISYIVDPQYFPVVTDYLRQIIINDDLNVVYKRGF
jgi:indole-3-glycerol phosphate synthase